jgi:predicted  nucleic acid-binding Zn-ribbon protein
VSDSAPPEFASFHELEQLVRNLGEELAGFRKRALSAESRLKALEAAAGPADLFSHERLAAAEQENAELKRRLASAMERTNQVVAQLRFLRQQHERAGSDR